VPATSAKRFIVHCPSADLVAFEAMARETARLKPYGEVLVVVSDLAGKGLHEIPPGGSGWHEYAVNSPSLHRVFPHPALAPHVPADFARRNRELLLGKAAVLARLGLGAAFWGVEPFFVDEAFFRGRPHLRGPRVDHPRRSRREAFALCLDQPESQAMVAEMMSELRRHVPNLGAFIFKTNDAGAGICWASSLYSGPQGPSACRSLSPGQHVANFVNALHAGARQGGGDVPVYIGPSNFWNNEIYDIERCLPPNTHLAGRDRSLVSAGSLLGSCNPAHGLFDPLAVLAATERVRDEKTGTVFVDFRASYDRAGESAATVGRVLDLLIHGLEHPTPTLLGRLQSLRQWAAAWAGEAAADGVWQACHDLHTAMELRSASLGRSFAPLYTGVSLRQLTRPLVFDPVRLSPDEESYFLPHVFNVDRDEARQDWIDLHGSRMAGPPASATEVPGLPGTVRLLASAARNFESVAQGPAATELTRLGAACRVLASTLRSASNFYFAQLIRDRYADRVAAGPDIAKRLPGGTSDLLRWYDLARDELENAGELLALLESRGLDSIVHAADAAHEDTFRLGPDPVADLRRKVACMRAHWCDAEGYMQSPNK
jgi:hypothetical protein